MGLYVYAVGNADDDEPPPLQGVLDQPAYRLDAGPFCAVVSECPMETVRAERRHIAAAQRVLSALNREFDFLPMAFGTVTSSAADLRGFLEAHHEALTAQLKRVSGAVEMSLRLSLDVPDPIAYLVERTPALVAARTRVFGSNRKATYDAKIRLGQMFDEALRTYRETRATQVVAGIGDFCAEVISLPVRKETEIANLAALVARSKRDEFDEAVHVSATQIDEDITFNVSGPWPPHNFVQFDPGNR
ncbi:GvpL/GvpF family gas vesicle protein [Methyloferula stellata]|uniref:GvpL/GvpF family gas vesicle protein n=1 Tax=Methyloferula stellata TaxID=876270 RepID=UPI0003687415|nr:GvpL/GvpF family gas vesicle protein [Methyloferula stellata]